MKINQRLAASLASGAATRVVVVLRDAAVRGGGTSTLKSAAEPAVTDLLQGAVHFPRLGIVFGHVAHDSVGELADHPSIQDVQPAANLELIAPEADPNSGDTPTASEIADGMTWGIKHIDVPSLWEQGLTGSGVRVGHLDTGIDANHPALAGRLAAFAEFDDNGAALPNVDAYDSAQHGTHTAGTICGAEYDGVKIGVAPGVQLYSCRVIEYPQNALVHVLGGLDWLLGQDGLRIVSMSIGVKGYDPFLLDVMQRVRDAGVLPIVAVGNDGPGSTRSPGNYPGVVSVGASTIDDTVAFFSGNQTFQRDVDPSDPNLVAPGTNVFSAKAGGGLLSFMGTSQATPHVTGVAALLLERDPALTVDDLEQLLLDTCKPLTGQPPEKFGRGLVQPVAALARI